MQHFLDAVFTKNDEKLCESFIGLSTLISWIAGNDDVSDEALKSYDLVYFLSQAIEDLNLNDEKEARITDIRKGKILPRKKVCIYNIDIANSNINIEVVNYYKKHLALVTSFDFKVRNLLNFLSKSFDNNLVFKISFSEQRIENGNLVGSPVMFEERKIYLNDDFEHITINEEKYSNGIGSFGALLKERASSNEFVKEIDGNAAKKMIKLVAHQLISQENENE